MPTGEKASGSKDDPESAPEPKGKPCRPSNTHWPPPGSKDKNKNKEKPAPNPIPTPNPKHDTDIFNNNDFEFWKGQNLTIIKDQLNNINFGKHKSPNGSRMNKPHYLAEKLKLINEEDG